MSENRKLTIDDIEKVIVASKREWGEKILALIKEITIVKNIVPAQVTMLSIRHQLVDKVSEMQMKIFRLKEAYDTQYKEKYHYYKTQYNLKLNGGETNKFVAADLTLISRQIDILGAHVDYFKESIRTLDNLGFAIKNRLNIENDF